MLKTIIGKPLTISLNISNRQGILYTVKHRNLFGAVDVAVEKKDIPATELI